MRERNRRRCYEVIREGSSKPVRNGVMDSPSDKNVDVSNLSTACSNRGCSNQ